MLGSESSHCCAANWAIEREIVRDVKGGSAPPLIIVAPSGYGKTVVSAQVSVEYSSVTWIDCARTVPDLTGLIKEHRPEISQTPPSASSRCIVLDDVALDELSEEDCEHIARLAGLLRATEGMLIINGVSSPHRRAQFRDFRFVSLDNLRLSDGESMALSKALRRRTDIDSSKLLSESSGHIALFVALAEGDADGRTARARNALSAWVEHLLSELSSIERRTVLHLALLGRMDMGELHSRGLVADAVQLHRLVCRFPLLSIEGERFSNGVFVSASDSLANGILVNPTWLAEDLDLESIRSIVEAMVARGQTAKSCLVVSTLMDDDFTLAFLACHGHKLIIEKCWPELESLLSGLPLHRVMSDYHALLMWAWLEEDRCRDEESLAKAKAAYVLASHAGDTTAALRAQALMFEAYNHLCKWKEAIALAESFQVLEDSTEERTVVQIQLTAASMHLQLGDVEAAAGLVSEALCRLERWDDSDEIVKAKELQAIIAVVALGDYFGAVRLLTPLLNGAGYRESRRPELLGNLGILLTEVGRLDRSVPLLRKAAHSEQQWHRAHYLPALACALLGRGDEGECSALFDEALSEAANGDQEALPQIRVYESVALRATGRPESALTSAERAHEALAVHDTMHFRRLAALEVAASLLAMGDSAAARSWAEPVVDDGFGDNHHHALRAAMILAECDRRDGRLGDGVERLRAYRPHILTENSNWQMAMYIRAFPELLGMFALAVGVRALPAHMLKMVLPEHAEKSLRSSREWLEGSAWRELGLRVLNEEQLQRLEDRKGRPACYVRVLGGLEVTVDGRSIAERDWRKRKARLLFVMIALRRGSEIPRDELLDQLWPDLDEERAKNNFYVVWSAMKAALMGCSDRSMACPYIASTRGRCRIVPEAVHLDLDDFDEAVRLAKEAEVAGKPAAAINAYDKLSTLYRGDLLPGDVYDDFFRSHRDGYRSQFITAMSRAAELLLHEDDPCEALVYARRGLSVDPLREDLYQLALRCHILAGQRSAAIDMFLQCRSTLGEELGLDPSTDTMRLYQEILTMEECPRTDSYGIC